MFRKLFLNKKMILPAIVFLVITGARILHAQEEAAPTIASNAASIADTVIAVDTVWTLFCAFLVFFMQAGFAMVETGFTRAKNAGNIIMKNQMDFAIGSLAYFLLGFGIMFGTDMIGGFFGWGGDPAQSGSLRPFTFWLFQVVFAATAATIVSGAMAERTKFTSYLIYSGIVSALIYPVVGHWIWGGGWLSRVMGGAMIDFAGSTVVHSVGGWCALAGAMILGPRIGKYGPNGQVNAIPGHNIPLAALGVFILWFGWFGFNPGSTVSGLAPNIAHIAVTTNLAAAAGACSAMIFAWFRFGKPDISMTLNGALAGLVAITAPCANVSPQSAIIIGLMAGVLVVVAVEFIDKVLKIDDPVGAISVHGMCGSFGTMCVGLFAQEKFGGVNGLFFGGGVNQLLIQLTGIASVFVWTFSLAFIMFKVLSATVGLRVTQEEELRGLDIDEHGCESYSGFQIFSTQ
jgi:Amt family ammonium transporter